MKIKEFAGPYRFLSNFYAPAEVVLDGVMYPTVEDAYQAAKTYNLSDRKRIEFVASPGQAKSLGRKLKLRPDWEQVKLGIMENLVMQKFSSNPYLKRLLLVTDEDYLQAGNTWGDRFWGVDLKCKIGENHLGRILMRVRGKLRR